jgi:hypothetical protein
MMLLTGIVIGALGMLVLLKATETKKEINPRNRSLVQKLKTFNIFN